MASESVIETVLELAKSTKTSLDTCISNYLSLAKLLYELVQKIQEVCREESVKSVLKKHGLCT